MRPIARITGPAQEQDRAVRRMGDSRHHHGPGAEHGEQGGPARIRRAGAVGHARHHDSEQPGPAQDSGKHLQGCA